jgi:osmotically-inducible protein OsmY
VWRRAVSQEALRWELADRAQKRMAEHAAELVRGVRDVRNELRVSDRR